MNKIAFSIGLMAAAQLFAQATGDGTTPADEPAFGLAAPSSDATAWKVGPFAVSGLLDGSWNLNLNRPADHVNGLHAFDKADQIDLRMALLTVDLAPSPVGFHLEAVGGRFFDVLGSTEKDATGMRFFEEAYFNVKPASWKGLELDFGKFSSWASAEVIETPGNGNYSRSLLFVWCTPDYHLGVRATAPIGKKFTAGVQLVSGWNTIVTGATFHTVGVTTAWAPTPKLTWINNWYGGPDENTANRGMRNLYDSVLELAPGARTSFYLNFDFLHESPRFTQGYQTYGIAGAARFRVNGKLSLSPRLEWLSDSSGMTTGASQQVGEFTMTATYALLDRLSLWVECRNDWSNRPFFNRGAEMAVAKTQPSVLVALVAVLRPKR